MDSNASANVESFEFSELIAVLEEAASTHGQEDILHAILQLALRQMGAQRGDIALWNAKIAKLQIMALGGVESDLTVGPGNEVPLHGFIHSLWESNDEYLHSDKLEDGNNYVKVDGRVVSEIAIQLKTVARRQGILNLEFFQALSITPELLAKLRTIARVASCAIQIVGQNVLLQRVSSEIPESSREALPTLLESIRDIYGYDRALLYYFSPQSEVLHVVASLPSELLDPPLRYNLEEPSFAKLVFKEQEPQLCLDPTKDENVSPRGVGRYGITNPLLGLPVKYGTSKLGVLVVWNSTQSNIQENGPQSLAADLKLLSPIANIAAVHLAVDRGIGSSSASLSLVPGLLNAAQRGLTEEELITLTLLAVRSVGFERVRYYTFDDDQKCFDLRYSIEEGDTIDTSRLQQITADRDLYVNHTIATYLENPNARIYDPTDPSGFGPDPYASELGKPLDLPWLVAPISVRGRLCGQLTADNAISGKPITDTDLAHANLMAACCGFAIKQLSELDISGWQPSNTSGRIRVFRKNIDLEFVYVNSEFARDLGRAPSEIVGERDSDFYPEWLWRKFQSDDHSVLTYKLTICDTEHCLIGGEFTSVAVYKTPLVDPDGRVIGLQGFYILEPFRSLFDSTHEGIFQIATNGCYRNVNVGLARLLGYDSPADLLVAGLQTSRDVYANEELRERQLSLVEKQKEVRDFECELLRKDGTRIKVNEHCRAVMGDNNTTLYYEGFVEDIELRLRASAKVWNEERRQHEKILQRFLGHDVAAALRRFEARYSSAFTADMQTELLRLTDIFERLTKGDFSELNHKPTQIGQSIMTAKNSLEAERRKLSVKFDISGVQCGHRFVLLNHFAFVQLLENIFSNSVKALASVDGERVVVVCATVGPASPERGLSASLSAEWLELEVSDNGPGVPANYKMLQRSTILHDGKKEGVGLFIIKKFVDLAGGYVEILDNFPTGTTVKIALPAKLI